MKNLLMAVISVYAVSVGWTPLVLAQEANSAPLDFRACKYRSGTTKADLDIFAEKFRQYGNANDIDYSAWMLFPQYHGGVNYDMAWLGSWPNGEAFGVSMERWNSAGLELQAAANELMDCSIRHELVMSLPITAPDSTIQDGVLLLSQCALDEGKTLEDAYAAHLKLGDVNKSMGSLALTWMFVPALGAGNIDFDYYQAHAFYRYSDLGATMELYGNHGLRQNYQKILKNVSSCGTWMVFDAVSVRAADER